MQFCPKKTEAPYDAIDELVSGLDLSLLECTISQHRGVLQARLVIYSPKGVGVTHCSTIHRLVQSRLELMFPKQDIYIEVSSPGVNRRLKDAREFAVFKGKSVKCLRTGTPNWLVGIIEEANSSTVSIRTSDGTMIIPYELITKAMLIFSQEDQN